MSCFGPGSLSQIPPALDVSKKRGRKSVVENEGEVSALRVKLVLSLWVAAAVTLMSSTAPNSSWARVGNVHRDHQHSFGQEYKNGFSNTEPEVWLPGFTHQTIISA